ncbi:MAG: type II toxin-antitoxin system HicA family toxin [Nitrospirota bacterium]
MSKYEKLLLKILSGTSDANIQFEDLCSLLKHLGFDMRVKGSHHIFRKEMIIEKINLQRDGNMAKAYQVKQVRNIIVKYKLGGTIDV